MLKLKLYGIQSIAWLMLMAVVATGCAQLITPRLETEVAEIKAGQYRLDAAHAALLFKVNHMGFSQYVGRFNRFDASLDFEADAIENSSLEALIDMNSIDVNNPDFEKTLRDSWFKTEQFPQAVFKTTSAKKTADNSAIFTGDLTFLGVTRPVDLEVTVNGAANNLLTGKYTLGFSATAEFSRSEFGLARFIPAVGDKIHLEIHAEFQRQ